MARQNINWKLELHSLDRISTFKLNVFIILVSVLTILYLFTDEFLNIHFSIHIKSLKVNEKMSHECSAIFFTAGRFKTNIECSHVGSMTTDEHHSMDALAQTYALNMDGEQIDLQVWRYIPAPEITVIEHT